MAIDRRETTAIPKLFPEQEEAPVLGSMNRVDAPQMEDLQKIIQEIGIVQYGMDAQNQPTISVNLDAINDINADQEKDLFNKLAKYNLVPKTVSDAAQRNDLERHGVSIALFPELAGAHLLDSVLPAKDLTASDVMKAQASLNRLGYDAGSIDGALGRKSANAVGSFLNDYPNESTYAGETVVQSMGRYLPKDKMDILFEGNPVYKPQDSGGPDNMPRRNANGHVLMNPEMIRAMEQSTDIRQYVETAQAAALNPRLGGGVLDPNMFANQLWKESLSILHANPSRGTGLTSHAGAVGIGQFLPSTGARYGLDTPEKLANPVLSIHAAAMHMRDMTKEYGDQRLALVAYNGGPGAVNWAAKHLSDPKNIKIDDWMKHADASRERAGAPTTRKQRGLWHNETRDYVRSISSDYWPKSRIERALSMDANKRQMLQPDTPETVPVEQKQEKNPVGVRHADAADTIDPLATQEGYDAHLKQQKNESFEKPADARFGSLEKAAANININSAFSASAAKPEGADMMDASLDPALRNRQTAATNMTAITL